MPQVIDNSAPPGEVRSFTGGTLPPGFLLCDGSAISRTTYAALFAAIGVAHGSGDGSTTFNLPDHRGRFLRGWANGSTNDPDRAGRTAMASGGSTGDNVGSVQGHAYQTHAHTDSGHNHALTVSSNVGAGATSANAGGTTGTATYTGQNSPASANIQSASPSGGTSQASSNETRPVNAYVKFMIRY